MARPAVRLVELVEGLHFHLHRGPGRDVPGLPDRRRDAAAGGDMVLLDQEGVPQADAVVVAAATGHRVLLRQAQPGQGLAGVEQPHAGVRDQVDIVAGAGGGGREGLQQVQRRALPGEQAAGRALDLEEGLAGLEAVAVRGIPAQGDTGIQATEQLVDPGHAAQHAGLAGDHPGRGVVRGGNQPGGDVAGPDVLGQQTGGAVADLFGKGVLVMHGGASLSRLGPGAVGRRSRQ